MGVGFLHVQQVVWVHFSPVPDTRSLLNSLGPAATAFVRGCEVDVTPEQAALPEGI